MKKYNVTLLIITFFACSNVYAQFGGLLNGVVNQLNKSIPTSPTPPLPNIAPDQLNKSIPANPAPPLPNIAPDQSNSEQPQPVPTRQNSATARSAAQERGSSAVAQGASQPTAGLPEGSPTSEDQYCQRITSNPAIIQLANLMSKYGKDSPSIRQTYLDNTNGDLEKWVASNISKLGPSVFKTAQDWVNGCVAKNSNTPFSLIALPSPEISFSTKELKFSGYGFQKNVSAGKLGNYPMPKEATLLAFLFPDVEKIIANTAPEPGASFKVAADARQAEIKKAELDKDIQLYSGIKSVYIFRTHPSISASYGKCVNSEKQYHINLTKEIEAEAKKANTVAEQKAILDKASYRTKYIDYFAHSWCVYRLNVAITVVDGNDEAVAYPAFNMQGRENENLNGKYTNNALIKISDLMNLSADKFHSQIEDFYTKSKKTIDNSYNLRMTREQQQQAGTGSFLSGAMPSLINGEVNKIVGAFAAGKIQ